MSVSRMKGRIFFRRYRWVPVVLATALLAAEALALPPEHEVRRLMLATETAVQDGNWGEAGEYLNRLQAIEANKPADYLFYRGRVMYEAGHLNEARSALEQYVSASGSEGRHYNDALELITDVERAQRRSINGVNQVTDREPVAVIEPAGEESLENLRRLYLTDSDTTALTTHLNSLLELNGWREDRRIVRTGSAADVEYRIATGNGEVRIQESRLASGSGQRQVSTEVLSVYGISPLVRWDCDVTSDTCWIYDPRDGSRLLQLGNDRTQTRDAARTLGRLIKTLQNPA